MSSISTMREKYNLPPPETDLSSLSATDIINRIKSFISDYENAKSNATEEFHFDFLELMSIYPVSMCQREMTDTLKLIISLYYVDSKQLAKKWQEEDPNDKDPWKGYSYEHLALLFSRSKATIHDAIKQKEIEAKALLSEPSLRLEARKIALEQLIAEEKEKLHQTNEKTIEQSKEQTNERL
jgi:hypothetical protein